MGRSRGRGPSPESLRDRIEDWRRSSGGRGRRIPEQLWVEAVEVARVHGVRDAARLLRLDRRRLERRVEGESGALAAEFVEIPSVAVGPPAIEVEFVGADGDRVRVAIPGGAREPGAIDVVALAQAFWSRR
jgi:hypothetical protein